MAVTDEASGVSEVFGAAPDGATRETVYSETGDVVTAPVRANGYRLQIAGELAGVEIEFADGSTSAVP